MTAAPSMPAPGGVATPPARPVRFDDPAQNAAYWARVRRIVDTAPPLDDNQRATIRAAFHGARQREAA